MLLKKNVIRRSRTKALWVVIGVVGLAMLVSACGSSDSTGSSSDQTASSGDTSSGGGGEPVNIAFFTALGNTYLEATLEGLEESAEKGGDVDITTFDSKFDATTQFQQIQDAITLQKFDAFVIWPVDGNALVPVVKQAAAAGIKVVDTNFPIGDDFTTSQPQVEGVDGSVILPASDVGKALGEMTIQACEKEKADPCKVAEIEGYAGSPFDTAAEEAIQETLKSAPQVEIVANQAGEYLADPAYKAVQNILQANPDIKVITTIGDQMANGAEKAVAAAGLTGKVQIIGEAASVPGVEKVRDGKWFGTVIALPKTEGRIAGEMVIKAARGEAVNPNGVNPVEQAGLPPYITQENAKSLADFTGEWKG
jgi:ribose transport system substrate-binding protein